MAQDQQDQPVQSKFDRRWLVMMFAALVAAGALLLGATRPALAGGGGDISVYCSSYHLVRTFEDGGVFYCIMKPEWRKTIGNYCVWELLVVDGVVVDGRPVSEACPDSGGDDGRVNSGHGDHIAAVYVDQDDHAKPALKLYCITPDLGEYAGQIDQALLDTVSHPPSTDTLLKTFDACSYPVRLYALTTGQYQLNFGPDAEGHTAVMVFSGLPPTDVSYYDLHVN